MSSRLDALARMDPELAVLAAQARVLEAKLDALRNEAQALAAEIELTVIRRAQCTRDGCSVQTPHLALAHQEVAAS